MKRTLTFLLSLFVAVSAMAQERLTKEQILAMSADQLSELPLEDLMQAVETLGVTSVDELFALIMNKNVSSASKEEESTFTSPLSSTVITHDEMKTYGVTTIEEALRLIPGMIITEKTNGVYDVQMRGLNNIPDNNMLLYTENSNTLVMIDGRPVHNYAMGAITFEMFPIDIEDIERIEVVRGASGALYGANAVTGVINIITTKPDNSSAVVSGSLQMGNHSTVIGNAALRSKFNDKFSAGLTVNMQQRNRPTSQLYVIPASGVVYSDDNIASGTTLSLPELQKLMAVDKTLSFFQDGGYLDADKIKNLKQLFPVSGSDGSVSHYVVFDVLEPETPISQMIPNPSLARRSMGVNGYVAFTPADRVRFDLTGGYQQSYINSTPVGDDYFSFNGRETKNGYIALAADVKDLRLLLNYSGGPANYAVGVPGFKVYTHNFNASAEYDIKVGSLGIRPGLSYQRISYEDYVPDYDNKAEDGTLKDNSWSYRGTDYRYAAGDNNHLSGFFNYDAEMTTLAPSLRLDYKLNNIRFIGAFRADKTNIPDKWNCSWQLSANCAINDKNFIRFVYGRANRSAIIVNSNSNFTWTRTNLTAPKKLTFLSNKDADLVYIDNFEIGYRLKPTERILLDAEAFYSRSRNYGALMANRSLVTISYDNAQKYIDSYFEDISNLANDCVSVGMIQYGVLPYKVSQMGFSMNIDWIISPKLIAKLNFNLQKTIIDNYFPYSQTAYLKSLLLNSQARLYQAVAQIKLDTDGKSDAVKDMIIEQYIEKYLQKDDANSQYKMATEESEDPRLGAHYQDDFENQATPNFYGMLGLVYKPTRQWNIAAFANYIGERSYITKYSSNYVDLAPGENAEYSENGTDLSKRFTINLHAGYKPVDNCEVFVNAHNLLNNKKREFVYSDEIGGLYTIGVNFEF